MATVGAFTFENNVLSGPKAYMAERGDALVERCLAGESVVFNQGLRFSPNPETALLVALQTDYAAWKGNKQLESWAGGAK